MSSLNRSSSPALIRRAFWAMPLLAPWRNMCVSVVTGNTAARNTSAMTSSAPALGGTARAGVLAEVQTAGWVRVATTQLERWHKQRP
jgi:hypothetical protein